MSLTAANAIIQLGVTSVFPAPQQLQGFGADDVFSTAALASVETSMGVDGILSGGFVEVEVKQTYTLQADSTSMFIFDDWWNAMVTQQEAFTASGVIVLKAVGIKWNMTKGFLTEYKPMPDAGKLLKVRQFGITWNKARKAPVGVTLA